MLLPFAMAAEMGFSPIGHLVVATNPLSSIHLVPLLASIALIDTTMDPLFPDRSVMGCSPIACLLAITDLIPLRTFQVRINFPTHLMNCLLFLLLEMGCPPLVILLFPVDLSPSFLA